MRIGKVFASLLLREKVARAKRVTDEELVKDIIIINTSSTASGPPSPTGEGLGRACAKGG